MPAAFEVTLSPECPRDAAVLVAYSRHVVGPLAGLAEAEEFAVILVSLIRAGEMSVRIVDGFVVQRSCDGDGDPVALSDLGLGPWPE